VRLSLFLALPLALVACGGSHRSTSTSVPRTALGRKACSVRIFFATGATHAQEQAVGATLRGDSLVKQVVFVSKAQALVKFKKKFPGIYEAVKPTENPLPDSFTVVPVSPSHTRQVGATVAHAPGVDTTRLAPCKPVR
jgi:cell division protein FtsX